MSKKTEQALLVLNSGSSSLKFSLYDTGLPESGSDTPRCIGRGSVEAGEDAEHMVFRDGLDGRQEQREAWPAILVPLGDETVARILGWIDDVLPSRIVAAAHRVVHGGYRTQVAATVDAALMEEMKALIPMAPLHQPRCLAPINHLAREQPELRQFACFDTAFHRTLDPLETRFGLPAALTDQGLRRYGFHGLSYESIASQLADHDPRAAQGKTIVAHLGNGASLCALQNRVSRATTMGFSTLDGLLMGTRPGRLDPGIVLYLLRERGMTVQGVEHLLYHRCGLLGVSGGIASDLRTLMASTAPQAADAIALFVRYIVKEIGALAAVLGGIDALVLTGGIGEHTTVVSDAVLDGCRWLGIARESEALGPSSNRLSRADSAVMAWMIPTDENAVMAHHALKLLHDTG